MNDNVISYPFKARSELREQREAARVADVRIGPSQVMSIFAFPDLNNLVEVRYLGDVIHLTAAQADEIAAALHSAWFRCTGGLP